MMMMMMMMMIRMRRDMRRENEETYAGVMEKDGGSWRIERVKHVRPASNAINMAVGASSREEGENRPSSTAFEL